MRPKKSEEIDSGTIVIEVPVSKIVGIYLSNVKDYALPFSSMSYSPNLIPVAREYQKRTPVEV